ncbi:MAG: hypothetical protein KAI03_01070 [Candidatus Aureabacteria bacterium]|nr:hypothetical protein [Candidatus Auribacterota bacterium]
MNKDNIVNEGKLHIEVQKKIIPYIKKMSDIHGDNLIAVFVYGSAAGENYIPKVSDINSVFVFKNFEFSVLRSSLSVVSKGIVKKIAAPLFLTKDYINSSLDVFPIEFLDMKENHILLYGEDIFTGLEIKGEHIRLFCEQQVKGKLIRIRQAYLEVGLKKKGLESLLKESLNSLIPIFRNLIRLKGKQPSVNKAEIIRQLCQMFELDKNVFLSIYKDSSNDEKIANQEVVVFLEKYLSQIEKLADMVDKL